MLALAAVMPTAIPVAEAQSPAAQKETARGLVLAGRKKRQSGDGKGALADFKAAWSLVKNPTTGFELGKQQVEMGLLVEARDTLLEVGRLPVEDAEPPVLRRARDDAKALAEEIAPKIPSLKVVIVGAKPGPLDVTVDDVGMDPEALRQPLKLNPGIHSVVVRQGETERQAEAMLSRGETRELEIDLSASGADKKTDLSSSPSGGDVRMPHWITWVGLGTAVVGGVIGGVTGGIAISKSNEVAAGCPGGRCPPALHETLDEANAMAIGSTVAFALGGAGLGVMIVGFFLPTDTAAPASASEDVSVAPALGPNFVGVSGGFR